MKSLDLFNEYNLEEPYSERIDEYPEEMKLFLILFSKMFSLPDRAIPRKKDKGSYNRWNKEIKELMDLMDGKSPKEILLLCLSMYNSQRVRFIVSRPASIKRLVEEVTRRKNKQKTGFIYLIGLENGLYKIGKTKNMSGRMNTFSVKFPMNWELLHKFETDDYSGTEKSLHNMFADKRKIGEWFELSDDDVAYIMSL